jgi:hypothetical protein
VSLRSSADAVDDRVLAPCKNTGIFHKQLHITDIIGRWVGCELLGAGQRDGVFEGGRPVTHLRAGAQPVSRR